jgi:hypothetical protein
LVRVALIKKRFQCEQLKLTRRNLTSNHSFIFKEGLSAMGARLNRRLYSGL